MPINFIRNFIPEFNEAAVDDIGFDESITGGARLINSDGTFNITKKGRLVHNLYEQLIEMSWTGFYVRLTSFYFAVNAFFALILLANGISHIKGVVEGSTVDNFFQALFFSIQTFTTVGYGGLTPSGFFTNIIASFIAFSGLFTFALATGLFFARFSRPLSHLLFSKNMLITENRSGERSLQFRVANGTKSQLIDAEARVTLTWLEEIDGIRRRKFQRLDLEIEKIFMFPLNWTLVHTIDKNSPIQNQNIESLIDHHMEVLILIRAYDETYHHYVHTKKSYGWEDIVEDQKFVTMYETNENETFLYLDKISDTMPSKSI